MNFKKIEKIEGISELYNFVIDFWVEHSQLKKKIENILAYLCLTQKGLSTK